MGSAVPLGQALTELAQAAPDAAAVTCGEQTVTRAELESAANRLARSYAALGVQAGDFVSVSLGNGIEFFAVVFALWKLGAVPQLLAPSLPRPERDAILRLAKPTLVIGEAAAPQSVLPRAAVRAARWCRRTKVGAGLGAPHGARPLGAASFGTRGYRSPTPAFVFRHPANGAPRVCTTSAGDRMFPSVSARRHPLSRARRGRPSRPGR